MHFAGVSMKSSASPKAGKFSSSSLRRSGAAFYCHTGKLPLEETGDNHKLTVMPTLGAAFLAALEFPEFDEWIDQLRHGDEAFFFAGEHTNFPTCKS